MDTRRFSKLRNSNDIKLEKERLRYEILIAENQMMDNFHSVEDLFSIPSFFSRITYGFNVGHNVYNKIRNLTGKFNSWRNKKKKKKIKKDRMEHYDED